MPDDLISYEEWKKLTSLPGRVRSRLLRELDEELKRYEEFGGGQARWSVEQSLKAWKQSKGPGDTWKHTARNRRKRAFEELTLLLEGGDDRDASVSDVPDFMHPDLVHARLGVLYLFANMDVQSNLFNVVLEGGIQATGGILGYAGADPKAGGMGLTGATAANLTMKAVTVPAGPIFQSAESSAYTVAQGGVQTRTLFEGFKKWISEFIAKLGRTLKEKFTDLTLPAAAVKTLVNVCAAIFIKAAAPFIGSGMNMAKGAVNTLDAALVNFRSWYRGRHVDVAVGHPATVVDSIHRAMKLSLFEGLWQTLKGATAAGLTAATAGAAAIVNVAVALAELVTKVVWRLVEIGRMQRFFLESAEFWRNRGAPDAIQARPIAFGRWFRKNALNLPALSVLTLNSGICGDKTQFLKMYKNDGTPIMQSEFDRGVKFIDGLKPWGAEYLGKCGYDFQGQSTFTAKLIDFSAQHAKQRNKGWAVFRRIVTA